MFNKYPAFFLFAMLLLSFDSLADMPISVNDANSIAAIEPATMYYVDSNQIFGTLDPATGIKTPIGDTGVTLSDIAVMNDGRIYACSFGGTQIYSIDSATGVATFIGSGSADINALASSETDVLYGSAGQGVYSIDTVTGATSYLGSLGATSAGDILYLDNALFISTTAGTLVRFDLSNNTHTNVVSGLPANVYALAQDSDGVIYASSNGNIYTIDLEAGTTTDTGINHAGYIYGLASIAYVQVNVTGDVTPGTTGQDRDHDGDTITVSGVAAGIQASASGNVNVAVDGTYGSVVIAADGSYTYTVTSGAAGDTDVFTYTISDGNGGSDTATLTITISDDPDVTPPVLTLSGSDFMEVEQGASYSELGASANDNVDGNITGSIVTSGTVDTSVPGSYTITYNVTDAAGNAATPVTRTVTVNPDATPPIISLLGSATLEIGLGSIYTDDGATAEDNIDGNISGDIVTVNPVNTSIAETYTVTYNVSDAAGNAATQVTRTVTVRSDVIPPIISLLGSAALEIGLGSVYTDDGATAEDNIDGNISGDIVIVNPVNTSIAGTYTVTYNVSDSAGNAATQVTRAVTVTPDVTPPVITLSGSTPVSVEQGGTYADAGATALDNIDGNITADIVTVNPVNTSVVGSYTVTYNVNDVAGNAATQVTREVNVTADATPPVITLLGNDPVDIEQGQTYTDAGATALDNIDGNITGDIVTVNPVNTAVVGSYTVTYNVSDATGNAATQVTRVVNVTADVTPPVITLLGNDPVDIEQGQTYTDAGATATDTVDGDLTGSIVTVNPVDTAVVGSYTVTYNVSDAGGNAATQVTRVVNVTTDVTPPVITLEGNNPVAVAQGSVYSDAGATALDSVDGDLTSSIVATGVGSVDTSVLGASYTITYSVSDAAGNAATPVTRTVNITNDLIAPVISLVGNNPIDVPLGGSYTDAGATASDDIDGDITSSIVTVNPVDTASVGSYTITYNVSDAVGNVAPEVTRTVNVTFDPLPDDDGDGIVNGDEGTGDFDGDGVLDFQDLDSDNDGIPDAIEGSVDSDADNIPDYLDLDSDNDGLYDLVESGADYAALDTLNDGTIDVTNSVGTNGLADAVETTADSGTLSYNNGSPLDSDADGVEDYVDLDSDNDTLADVIEAGGVDPDGDGIVGTGVPTVDANGVATSGAALTPIDNDGDGVNDQIDQDSDNDGIMDVVETGGEDPDGDGQIGSAPADVNSKGLSVDGSKPEIDTDGDGVPNQRDLDSDNDGLPDVTEAGGDDPDDDGIPGMGVPTVDDLGIAGGVKLTPTDIDGDLILNPYDPDSDGDGIFDLKEAGGPDIDDDGLVDGFDDTNDDGFDDGIAAMALPLPDTDADGIPDYRDNDDTDNDGVADDIDEDDDNDGIPDNLEGDGVIDTDNDGIPDSRDLDSDNDGLYDLSEAGMQNPSASDTDNDGRIDSSASFGVNGFADNLETTVDSGSINYNGGTLLDTDGDSVKDFRDLDSDNDSIPDVIERGGDDGDGDGLTGTGTPSVNSNGLVTGAGSGPVDTDNDGSPDQQDKDADNDGIPDVQEVGNPDTNNNGEVDTFIDGNGDGFNDASAQAPLVLPDTDGDGIPDLRDSAAKEAPGPVGAGVNGVGGFNLGVLALLGVLTGLRRAKLLISSVLSLLILFVLPGQAMAQQTEQAQADEQQTEQQQEEYQRHFYIGAGIGRSTLEPTTEGSIYSLDEDTDTGTRLYGGMDLSENFSVEFSLSDLGTATFKPTGQMDYSINAVNLLYYLYNEGETQHVGLGAYIKAGIGSIDATSDIPYEVSNSTQIAFGAGLEYAWENGFAVRGDVESFDEDASLVTVGLLYRFGMQAKATPQDSDQDGVLDPDDQCPQTPLEAPVNYQGCQLDSDHDGVMDLLDKCPTTEAGVIVDSEGCTADSDKDGVIDILDQCPATEAGVNVDSEGCAPDSDKDGVIDIQDQCPATPANTEVDENGCSLDADGDGVLNIVDKCPGTIKGADVNFEGCAVFETRIEGVHFMLASAELTGDSKLILDKAASEIVKFPSVIVEVQAHTDSQGTLENNQNLSNRRADSVVNYLVSRGVPRDSLVAKGYGETSPVVSNQTVEGRAQNRRVELRVLSATAGIEGTVNKDRSNIQDDDADGVFNSQDNCPNSLSGDFVDSNGCAKFDTNIAGISFELASLDLTAGSKKVLDKVAKSLLSIPGIRLQVQAHTDSQGEIENNQKLSEARAMSVVDYLVSKGVPEDRLEAIGYGESRPLASNRTVEGRAKNRRVEFKVIQ